MDVRVKTVKKAECKNLNGKKKLMGAKTWGKYEEGFKDKEVSIVNVGLDG